MNNAIILCSANVLAAANDPQSDHAFHPSRDVASTTEKHGPIGGFCISGGRKCRVGSGPEWASCTEYTDLITPVSASSELSVRYRKSLDEKMVGYEHPDELNRSVKRSLVASSKAVGQERNASQSAVLSTLGETIL